VARRGHNLLLDQFASLEETGKRFATYREAIEANGFRFDPARVGVARAFYVARNNAEKEAALDRRLAAQRRLHTISQRPDGNNTASIMAFSDTRAASEESALYGNPDEIARKLETLRDMGVEYILLNGGGTSRENLRRFAKEIMPAFHTEPEMRAAG
jgi:alkanesulfonate monooxygenase SsuD/methylene tetrahydromethanopterin reductase-like flavin-dependent oxidoreductase (luciferase family)